MINRFDNFDENRPVINIKIEHFHRGWEPVFMYQVTYTSKEGEGTAQIGDQLFHKVFKTDDVEEKSPVDLTIKDDEKFILGIRVFPKNKGIGSRFLLELFDKMKVKKFYLQSEYSGGHPYWDKVAHKTNLKGHNNKPIYTITKDDIINRLKKNN